MTNYSKNEWAEDTESDVDTIFDFEQVIKAAPIQAAARSKSWVCGRLVAGIAGSCPARGMDVCLLCLYVVLSCVGRGLCDGLITRPEESYCASNFM
jgi:hypothetical protein